MKSNLFYLLASGLDLDKEYHKRFYDTINSTAEEIESSINEIHAQAEEFFKNKDGL